MELVVSDKMSSARKLPTTKETVCLCPLNLFAAMLSHLLSFQFNLKACLPHLFSHLHMFDNSHLITFSFSPNFDSFYWLVDRLLLLVAGSSPLHYWSCRGQRPRPGEHRWGGGKGRMVHLCVKTHVSNFDVYNLFMSLLFLWHRWGGDGEHVRDRERRWTLNLDMWSRLPPAIKSSLCFFLN